jgi:hypothetical protein
MWKELKEKSIKLLDNQMRFEDEKGSDSDQILSRFVQFYLFIYSNEMFFFFYFSQKNVNTIEETTDTFPSSTTSESKTSVSF